MTPVVYDEFTDIGRRRVFQFFRDGKEHVAVMTERPLASSSYRSVPWTQIALRFAGYEGKSAGVYLGKSEGRQQENDFEVHADVVVEACGGHARSRHNTVGLVSESFMDVVEIIAGKDPAIFPQWRLAQLPDESL